MRLTSFGLPHFSGPVTRPGGGFLVPATEVFLFPKSPGGGLKTTRGVQFLGGIIGPVRRNQLAFSQGDPSRSSSQVFLRGSVGEKCGRCFPCTFFLFFFIPSLLLPFDYLNV